ncbi:MAG: hypothetical protein HY554_05930 [Elusimicrobia bacterium]|nr:hypothetical protein [Elusimicrobiota bacterium]
MTTVPAYAWAVALVLAPAPALAQPVLGTPAVSSPTIVVSTMPEFGPRLPASDGPWILGEVRFHGNRTVAEYLLRTKIRARRGILYTPGDIRADVDALVGLGVFSQASSGIFATDEPVPSQYAGIVVSTTMVRLVYFVDEKGAPAAAPKPAPAAGTRPEDRVPPAAVSGVIMTPTAYRGLGRYNRPGLGLDFNGVYYIGRLYGKNNLSYTTQKTNFIDRVGVWFLTADAKMQLQSETRWRPAMAAGVQGAFTFRDAPQPSITTPGVTVNVSQKTTRPLANAYVVFSKKTGFLRSSVGWMQGNSGDSIGLLTEFLSPQALLFNGHREQEAKSKSILFASLLTLPKPAYPLAVEILKPNGMALQPYLLNFKLGYFLKLNFDVAYLKFNGGWDLLGMFQFRYNYFPSR